MKNIIDSRNTGSRYRIEQPETTVPPATRIRKGNSNKKATGINK
jgi:hypothetical protein